MKARVLVSNGMPMLVDDAGNWLPPCDLQHWDYFKGNEGQVIDYAIDELGTAIGFMPSYNNPDNSGGEPDTISCQTCIPIYAMPATPKHMDYKKLIEDEAEKR